MKMNKEIGFLDKPVYEYYFYLNGERIKADYCLRNVFGRTKCYLEDKVYNNITSEYVLVDVLKDYYKGYYDVCFACLVLTLSFCLLMCFYGIFRR